MQKNKKVRLIDSGPAHTGQTDGRTDGQTDERGESDNPPKFFYQKS